MRLTMKSSKMTMSCSCSFSRGGRTVKNSQLTRQAWLPKYRLARSTRRHSPLMATATSGTKLLSKAEIPAFIPRSDLISEMLRWATIDADTNGFENFGMEMSVEPYYKDQEEGDQEGEKELWGFDVRLLDAGEEVTRIGIRLDGELVTKHEFVSYGEDGFPKLDGRQTEVHGKHFEIW